MTVKDNDKDQFDESKEESNSFDSELELDTNQENDSQYLQEENEDENASQEDFEEEKENNKDQKKESRFKEGQILNFVNVRFAGNAKSFPFYIGNKKFTYGQKVVALSDRGMDIGYINSFPYQKEYNKSMDPIKSISKVATDEDIKKNKELEEQERKAEKTCLELIEKYNLDMNLTHVEFIQFGKKAVFYFTAPERVDFRNLVKDLVQSLKMRIELRQISVRDRAAGLGAVGPCGEPTCCSYFLKNYGNVTIKMAKNQKVNLLPGKVNGVCGQIKCCIRFEDHVYTQKRKILPKEGTLIKTANGDRGKVIRIYLFEEEFELLTSDAKIRRYVANQYDQNDPIEPDFKLNLPFEHVTNETKEVIGKIKNQDKENCEICSCPQKDNNEVITTVAEMGVEDLEKEQNKSQNKENFQNKPQQTQKNNNHSFKKKKGRYFNKFKNKKKN